MSDIEIIKLSPDSFTTTYLRDEEGQILRTENGRRIIVDRIVPTGWIPLRIYDYEKQLNENKREIKLVDVRYASQIEKELRKFMRE
jgi:hypothetical protein